MTLTLKLPQIVKIVKSQCVFGISIFSYYMENLSSLNTAAQGRHVGLPLSSYGEPLVVVAQNMVALCLIWKLNKEVPLYEKVLFSIFLCFYAYGLFADDILPESAWKIVATSNILLNAAARIPQIW